MSKNGDASARPAYRRRVLATSMIVGVASAAALAALPAAQDTLASFQDSVWTKASGLTAAQFGIEGSLDNSSYSSHNTYSVASDLKGSTNPATVALSTPISLIPGQTTYSPLYLRTISGSSAANVVAMSAATKQESQNPALVSDTNLWNTYVRYAVRAVPVATSATCDASVFSAPKGTQLLASGTPMTAAAPATTFSLPAAASAATMLCFAFSLDSSVITGSPSSNGKHIYPYWTFTAQS